MRKPSQIDEIRAYIETEGPTEVSRRTKLSRRTLQYITSGRYKPSYSPLA
jgi:hypothetical protein